ncbi:helicase [Candidatus Roizmanbacteria bacterium]|nr:helicase [Candidatus Roizmanbacteria bacterium]
MAKAPVILDLETKWTFREFDDPKKLGVTVAAVYDYALDKGTVFTEPQLSSLFQILENSSYVVGYNIVSFDLQVLSAYYPGNISYLAAFDLLDDIKAKIGRRLALNDLIAATLGKKKTGHGLQAVDLYKEGKIQELSQYCLADVMLTKELFDFGIRTGEIYYLNEHGRRPISVDWKKYLADKGKSESYLTLPF